MGHLLSNMFLWSLWAALLIEPRGRCHGNCQSGWPEAQETAWTCDQCLKWWRWAQAYRTELSACGVWCHLWVGSVTVELNYRTPCWCPRSHCGIGSGTAFAMCSTNLHCHTYVRMYNIYRHVSCVIHSYTICHLQHFNYVKKRMCACIPPRVAMLLYICLCAHVQKLNVIFLHDLTARRIFIKV